MPRALLGGAIKGSLFATQRPHALNGRDLCGHAGYHRGLGDLFGRVAAARAGRAATSARMLAMRPSSAATAATAANTMACMSAAFNDQVDGSQRLRSR